jgi:hypothetical protein
MEYYTKAIEILDKQIKKDKAEHLIGKHSPIYETSLKSIIEALTLTSVGCSKIIASVTYWLWQDSGHAMMDDHRETFTKVVEVEKLTDINELFTNVAKIEVLNQ